MPGLVDGKLRAVRQADCCEKPPALIGDTPGHFGSLALQLGEGGLNVVTHEVELVMARTVSRVNSKLGRGQGENEPASTEGMPTTSAKNARTFSASGENTIACIPVITPRS
jgi:hypothetical protein